MLVILLYWAVSIVGESEAAKNQMNPIVFYFADGTFFFIGLALVALAETLLLRFQKRFVRSILTLSTLIGIIFVLLSATPLPSWAYALWLIPVGGCLVFNKRAASF